MLDEILPPFEFTVEFLLLVVAWGSAIEAARAGSGSKVRRIAAVGFLLVGGAQFLLGLHVLPDGGAQDEQVIASLIRGAGYLLILAGFAKAPKPAATFGFLLPLAALPSNAPLAAAALAGLVAFRGATIHARDQRPETFSFATAFGFLAISEALQIVSGDGALVARYATRGLGCFLLMLWLFGRFNSIQVRFATRAIVSLVVGLLFLAAGFNVVISRTLARSEQTRLQDAAITRLEIFDGVRANAEAQAGSLAQAAFTEEVQQGDAAVQQRANAIAVSGFVNVDFLVVTDATTRPRALGGYETVNRSQGGREARPLTTTRAAPIAGSPVVSAVLDRANSASAIQRLTFVSRAGEAVNELVVLGAARIATGTPARPVGAVVVGFRIDAQEIGRLAIDTGAIAALEIGGELATIRAADGRSSELAPELRAAIDPASFSTSPESTTFSVPLGGDRYIVVAQPIFQDGVRIGSLVLATSPLALAGVLEGLTRVLFFLLLIALVVAGAYALRAGRRVTQPIVALTQASLDLRAGNLSARAEVTGDDEIRTLGAAFNAMAIDLEAATKDLKNSVETEASLRGRLEAIVQSMGDALVAVNSAGVVTTINRAAERLLGVQEDEVSGSSIHELLTGTAAGGEPLAEHVLQNPSGSGALRKGRNQRLIAFQTRPLAGANGDGGRVIVIRDETETRQAERMKDEFLANVSHELRTPLTPIRGFADILTRKEVSREKSSEYLRKILESSLRLERIVDILVDFAAIEAGRMAVRNEALPVAELVRDRKTEWTELEPDRTVRARVERGLARVMADPAIVVRSLDELIDNAMKFSEGPVTITATSDGTARAPLVRLTVSDRGPGIPDDRLTDVFRGFQQVDGGETREIGGLGLGLAFVKRAIEHIGGTVDVVSETGRGTDVSILLPAAPAAPARKKTRSAAKEDAAPARKKRSA